MRVFIFGTGKYYKRYYKWTEQLDVIALLDNNADIQGQELNGHKVISPLELNSYNFDRIYILSTYLNEIILQLLDLGVPRERIFCFFQLESLGVKVNNLFYYPQKYIKQNKTQKKRIVFISHELSITGAPRCLLQAGEILTHAGYDVVVASPFDGNLREAFLAIGIPVIVDEQLMLGSINDVCWLKKDDILFINTVKLYYLLLERPLNIPTIWWLHEPEMLYETVIPDLIKKINKEKLSMYTVSAVADKALHKVWENVETANLAYGIPDKSKPTSQERRNVLSKIKFIVIGYISKVKGHDILVEAISILNEKDRNQAEFLFVGSFSTEFGKELISKINRLHLPVSIDGEKTNEEVLAMLEDADVLICASRAETMSMAVTEGMMKEKVVIVSREAGIARYIDDGKNGLLFQSENIEDLKDKIAFCIRNKEKLAQIGMASRKTYLENFSVKKFEIRLKGIIKGAEKV